MSSSVGGGVKRVVIPKSIKKTIENIKEITGHTEDDIYSMLQECNMDPNETTQKLLSLDPFHEVKRKRDRKKENPPKESTEPRWKPGMQGQGNRGGRGNFPSRHISHDAGTSKNALSAKDKEIKKGAVDGVILPAPQDKKNKETPVVASSFNQSEVTATIASSKLEGPLSQVPPEANAIPTTVLSASDPILVPSQDSRLPVGTIKREVGSQITPVEQAKETPAETKTASAPVVESSSAQGKMFEGEGNNLASESPRSAPLSHVSSSIGRPPSNYNNRAHQAIGPQKVGPAKEWKPKPTNHIHAQGLATEVPTIPAEDHSSLKPESSIPDSKERKVKRSHISDSQHVIIPNHLHVPEVEKLGFQFGSFDASFGINSSSLSGPMSEKTASPSEASEEIAEQIEEQTTRTQDVLVTSDDGDFSDRPSFSSNAPRNMSPEGDFSSEAPLEHTKSKHEAALPTPGPQHHLVHASSSLNFGFVPQIIGSHIAPFENNEPQARDASRVPSFVVQQPFDPAGYYPQFYGTGADSNGGISPFHQPTVATKYNGNIPVVSSQASQSSQEDGNPLILSAAGPTPLATQAVGVMPTSIAVTQQQVHVFRQPTGLHLPHYPPNYIPYGPYFSPFYLPPAIHQFLSNGAFPPQPQPGGVYPAPQVATSKYPHPQYKPGSNTANSGHIGVPETYGPYGSSPTGYNPNPAVTGGNSTSNKDLGGSQFKESNGYVAGQQSEGSGVWIAAPGQDISGLQAGSLYNLPQGGQLAYTPAEASHGTFPMYHYPTQPVTTGPIHPLHQQP